jgi:hypothetical protein
MYQTNHYIHFRLLLVQVRSFQYLEKNVNFWIYFIHFVQYLCSELESGYKRQGIV